MLNNSPSFQSQLILSQIPLADILEGFRAIVREEIDAKSAGLQTQSKEIIDSKELLKRLNISEPTLVKWRQKKKVPFMQIGTSIRYCWQDVLSSLENKKPRNHES